MYQYVKIFHGWLYENSWMEPGSFQSSFAPLVAVLPPLHDIYPVCCQSTHLIVRSVNRDVLNTKMPKFPAQRENQQVKPAKGMQYQVTVQLCHLVTCVPEVLNELHAGFSPSLSYSDMCGEGRSFHSIHRHV